MQPGVADASLHPDILQANEAFFTIASFSHGTA